MVKHKLELLEEANQEYFNLIKESNEIMGEYGRIMNSVLSFKLPTIRIGKMELTKPSLRLFYRAKYDLSVIGREAMTLRDRFKDWNNIALTFCVSPHYQFIHDQDIDKQSSVIHYTNLLLHRTDRLNSDITLLQSNYNLRFSEIDNAINFWIAITAWGFTFLGFVVSAMGLLFL